MVVLEQAQARGDADVNDEMKVEEVSNLHGIMDNSEDHLDQADAKVWETVAKVRGRMMQES